MPTIKGDRTRVMQDFAAQMFIRGYSAKRLHKRYLVFLREKGVVRQEIFVYFLSHTHSQGKAYIGWPNARICCPQINQLIIQSLDMKRDTLGAIFWSAPLSSYPRYWLVSGDISDSLPIMTVVDDMEHYFDSRWTIESILRELIEERFKTSPRPVMQVLAAALLANREDIFDEIDHKTKASDSNSALSVLAKRLKAQF
jgi:hypothetical protein